MNVDTCCCFVIKKPASVFGETAEVLIWAYEIKSLLRVCVSGCVCLRDSENVVVKFGETKGVCVHLSVCVCVKLTVSPDCANLRSISRPCSGSCCYGDVWKKATNIFKQSRDYLLKKPFFSHAAITTALFSINRTNHFSGRLRNPDSGEH